MRLFGELVGIAFQMKDDLFDYNNDSYIGKPTGIDIKEQKMTLPLIFTLGKVQKREKKFIINTVKRHNTDSEKVARVIQLVHQNGGIDYTLAKMKEYKEKALSLLKEFEDNEARQSLELLLNYVIDRKK